MKETFGPARKPMRGPLVNRGFSAAVPSLEAQRSWGGLGMLCILQ
jgi:hypothetical protein